MNLSNIIHGLQLPLHSLYQCSHYTSINRAEKDRIIPLATRELRKKKEKRKKKGA